MLLYYCLERSRRRDSRAPSMRAIEKEAYRWADEGIDTLETASFYVQQQLQRFICESKECKQNQEPTRRVLGRQRFLWISVRS